MKKLLFILSLLFASSCGLNEENRRSVRLNLENGNEINLLVFEKKAFFGKERTLIIYANEHQFKERNCDDQELKIFGDKLWLEVAKRNDLSAIKSGVVYLARQEHSVPLYCGFFYSKKQNNEWSEN